MTELDNTTEEYALYAEQKYTEQYHLTAENYPPFKEQVCALLKTHTPEAYNQIVNLYNDQYFVELFKNEPDYAYMYNIIQIYTAELTAGRTETILDIGDSISDYVQLFQKAKHILWRIEFTDDDAAVGLMLHFIKVYKLSPFFIMHLLKTSAFTQEVYMRLVDIFASNNMISYEYYTLSLLNDLMPGDETILCLLTSLAISIGKRDIACGYLSQIKTPGSTTERIREKYGL